jgi:DNA ligase (NAD+)
VRRASLFNRSELLRKDIRVGDQVVVHRAGDVIPYVVKAVVEKRTGDERAFQWPDECPACGAGLVEEGAYLRCPNGLGCPVQLQEALQHWGGKHAMDIDQLGEKLVAQLVDAGLVKSLADVYRLDGAAVEGLERMGPKSAARLVAAIDASRRRPLARVIIGLGIRNVGEHVAKLLAERFRSLPALAEATEEQLLAVKGIGPEVAASVVGFFADPATRKLLAELETLGLHAEPPPEKAADASSPLAGKAFVFTGKMSGGTREDMRARVEALGARTGDSVSRKTDYLVAGDDAGSKLAKARELGVAVLTEAEFEALVREATAGAA